MYELLLIGTIGINISADFLDRHTTRGSDPYSLALWTGIVQSLLIFPIIGLVGHISAGQLVLCMIVGSVASFGRMRWYGALSDAREQLSRLAPFLRLSSVFVLLMAMFILHERLSPLQSVGAGCIIFSALLVTLERPGATLRAFVQNNRAASLVIVFSFSTACISVLYKYLLGGGVSMWTAYFYMRLFQLVPLLLAGIHTKSISGAHTNIRNLRLFVFGRVLQTGAAFLYLLVLKHIPLTRVEPIAALSPFLLLVGEWILTRSRQARGEQPAARPATVSWGIRGLRLAALAMVACGILLLGKK